MTAGRGSTPNVSVSERRPLVVDVDAIMVTARSDKEQAAPTFKRASGFTLCGRSWITDQTAPGTAWVTLRPGNAGSNTATDHIAVIRAALRHLPRHRPGFRPRRKILIRTDAAGATHVVLDRLAGQRLSYSVGFPCPTMPPSWWPASPMRCGRRPTTPAGRSVTVLGLPRSPTCSTCRPGRPGCG